LYAFIRAEVFPRVFLAWCLLTVLTACLPPRVLRNQPSDGRYQLKGEVISIHQPDHEVVVKHEAVAGFMAAMTMPYAIKNYAELAQLSKGDSISADVVVQNGDFWLENVRITHHAKD
jgi:Cu/Ag efflux protein CusF